MSVDEFCQIRKNLARAAKKEPTSLTLVLNDLPADVRAGLSKGLDEINRKASDTQKEEPSTSSSSKFNEGTVVVSRLRSWVDGIRIEAIEVQTCFPEVQSLLESTVSNETAVDTFKLLEKVGEKLDVLKTAVDYKKASIIMKLLEDGHDKKQLAVVLQCGNNYISRMMTFYNFCKDFPALRFAPYLYNTLLQYKKAIETAAHSDLDFGSKLMTAITPRFVTQCDDKVEEVRQVVRK